MTRMSAMPEGFRWENEPKQYVFDGSLRIRVEPETDFWQRTHYNFQRDNAHCLLREFDGDFELSASCAFEGNANYDQCGIILRIDPENWIKASTEYFDESLSYLGSVVTSLGYSDWAKSDVPSGKGIRTYTIRVKGRDAEIETESNGVRSVLRIAHIHAAGGGGISAGVYAACPMGKGFEAVFKSIEIKEG